MYVDEIKLAGKTENTEPTWTIPMEDVGEPTSFLDHVYLGCTQRECQISKDIVSNYRDMFESRILLEETISSWSYDMEGHAKKCVERYCEFANKTTQQLHKVATPRMDDHQLKEEEKGVTRRIVNSLFTNCSEMSVFGSSWET